MKHSDNNYFPALDGLRGLGVLLIMWDHAVLLFGWDHAVLLYGNPAWAAWFWELGDGGWIGVDLFFVVSGFLITGILLGGRHQEDQLKRFWIRRVLRILPLHFLYLAVLLAISLTTDKYAMVKDFGESWPFFLFLGNFYITALGHWLGDDAGLGIMWSLAIEEQFYLIWPFVIRYLAPRQSLLLCGVGLLIAPFIRGAFLSHGHVAVYTATFCHYGGLMTGAAMAILASDKNHREILVRWCRRLWPLGLAGISLVVIYPVDMHPTEDIWVYSLISLSFATFVGLVLDPPAWFKWIFETRWLMHVGKLCYGLYIWQVLVGEIVRFSLNKMGLGSLSFYTHIALWLVSLYVVVILSWYLWEQPFLKLKDRFAPTKTAKPRIGTDMRPGAELAPATEPAVPVREV